MKNGVRCMFFHILIYGIKQNDKILNDSGPVFLDMLWMVRVEYSKCNKRVIFYFFIIFIFHIFFPYR